MDAQQRVAALQRLQTQNTLGQQEVQANAFKLTEQQHAAEGDTAQAKLLQANTATDPETGLTKTDHQQVFQGLVALGYADRGEHYLATADANEKNLNNLQLAHVNLTHNLFKIQGDMLSSVLDAPPEKRPEAWRTQLANLKTVFASQPEMLKNIPSDYPGDAAAQNLANLGRSQEEKLLNALKTAEARKATGEAKLAESKAAPVDPAKFQAQIDAMVPVTDTANAGLRRTTMSRVQNARTVDDAEKALDEASKQIGAINVAKNTVPFKIEVANAVAPGSIPSGGALDQAAQLYLTTGNLPAMGMGKAGVAARIAVMNRAAQLDPQASLAANKATYKADATNLTKLQTTEGTLSAFEKTAGKNLDQFLSLADKIPDTGVPWLNMPIRLLNQQLVGSANMAAINAARDVALREIARVTNDPKLSGALTDSARAEVLGLSPQNATLPQIKAVAKVLKQDMANVHAGVNEQIDIVKAGLQGNPATASTATGPAQKVGRFEIVGVK